MARIKEDGIRMIRDGNYKMSTAGRNDSSKTMLVSHTDAARGPYARCYLRPGRALRNSTSVVSYLIGRRVNSDAMVGMPVDRRTTAPQWLVATSGKAQSDGRNSPLRNPNDEVEPVRLR